MIAPLLVQWILTTIILTLTMTTRLPSDGNKDNEYLPYDNIQHEKYSTIFVKSLSSTSSAETFFQSIFGNKSNSTSNQQVDQPHRADSRQSTLPKGNNINIKTYGVTSKKSASPEEKNVPIKTCQADNSKQPMLHTINIHTNPYQENGLDVKTHQSDFKDQTLLKETDQTLKTEKYYQLQKKNAVLKHELIVAGCIDEALDIEERIHTDLRKKLIDKAGKSEEDVTGYLQSGLRGNANTVIYDRNDSFESRKKLVNENYSKLPEDLQLEYMDATIFYHKDDRELVYAFLRDTGINTCSTQYKVALYDDINHETRSKLQHMDKTCECSMSIFVFITKTVTSQRKQIQNSKEHVPEDQEWNAFFEEFYKNLVKTPGVDIDGRECKERQLCARELLTITPPRRFEDL